MACHNRFQTKDKLPRFGTITNGKCIFCDEIESITHLFFACRVTSSIWSNMLKWLRMIHSPQDWDSEPCWITDNAKGKSIQAKLLKMCATKTIYHVWMVRNRKIFQGNINKELNLLEIQELIRYRAILDRRLWAYCNEL